MTWAKILEVEVAGLPCETLDIACDSSSSSSLLVSKSLTSKLESLQLHCDFEVPFLLLETWILRDMVDGVMLSKCAKKWFPLCSMLHQLVMLLQILHVICTAYLHDWTFKQIQLRYAGSTKSMSWKMFFKIFACLTMHMVYSRWMQLL